MSSIQEKLYMTFIQDDHYLFFLEGLRNTLILTFASFILGVVFGVILCAARRSSSPLLRRLSGILSYFLVEIPTMVLLMVFVYIIFGSVALPVMPIVIVGLTMKAGASLAEIFQTALDTVNTGELEAARTLGMSKWQAFRYVALPQAVQAALPLCINQFIFTMQETSVVGYLAVMDLTRAYSVVSSRTLDAFFGLVVITVIYFMIGALVRFLMGFLLINRRGGASA